MKVLVAMSGGVDSSVAASLLRDDGHDVAGVTMRLWGGASDTGCCSVSDVDDARRVAHELGIDHHVFNFSDEFERDVVAPYVDSWREGTTPNPCIECNRHLKFDALLRRAEMLDFDAVATGHHARIVAAPSGARRIGRAVDRAKDQSYVLYPLAGHALDRVLFPVGSLTKSEVRSRATALGLRTAAKPDSQDVCFISRREGRGAFLSDRMDLHGGTVVDLEGRPVGSVDAVELVTIGQRRGLGLAGGRSARYVTEVDVVGRRVEVGTRADLLSDRLRVDRVVVAEPSGPSLAGRSWLVQTSAHGTPRRARVDPAAGNTGALEVVWDDPQPKVATGQSAVFYDGDAVVGGGIVVGGVPLGSSAPPPGSS